MSDRRNRPLSPATKLAQALRFLDEETGAIVPPIQPSATYARDADYAVRRDYMYRQWGVMRRIIRPELARCLR